MSQLTPRKRFAQFGTYNLKKRRKDMKQKRNYSEIYKSIPRKTLVFSPWQNLRILKLPNNKIDVLPKELGTLPCLQELYLSENLLGYFLKHTKAWLDQVAIRNNLILLDLRRNYFTELPVQIGKLDALRVLDVCDNMLKRLPQSIGFLRNLKYLCLKNNMLSYLPGVIHHLHLDYIHIFKNPFSKIKIKQNIINRKGLPSLIELSARCIKQHRITYDTRSIPSTLVDYLDNAKCCVVCANACFDTYLLISMPRATNNLAHTVHTHVTDVTIIMKCYYCYLHI